MTILTPEQVAALSYAGKGWTTEHAFSLLRASHEELRAERDALDAALRMLAATKLTKEPRP